MGLERDGNDLKESLSALINMGKKSIGVDVSVDTSDIKKADKEIDKLQQKASKGIKINLSVITDKKSLENAIEAQNKLNEKYLNKMLSGNAKNKKTYTNYYASTKEDALENMKVAIGNSSAKLEDNRISIKGGSDIKAWGDSYLALGGSLEELPKEIAQIYNMVQKSTQSTVDNFKDFYKSINEVRKYESNIDDIIKPIKNTYNSIDTITTTIPRASAKNSQKLVDRYRELRDQFNSPIENDEIFDFSERNYTETLKELGEFLELMKLFGKDIRSELPESVIKNDTKRVEGEKKKSISYEDYNDDYFLTYYYDAIELGLNSARSKGTKTRFGHNDDTNDAGAGFEGEYYVADRKKTLEYINSPKIQKIISDRINKLLTVSQEIPLDDLIKGMVSEEFKPNEIRIFDGFSTYVYDRIAEVDLLEERLNAIKKKFSISDTDTFLNGNTYDFSAFGVPLNKIPKFYPKKDQKVEFDFFRGINTNEKNIKDFYNTEGGYSGHTWGSLHKYAAEDYVEDNGYLARGRISLNKDDVLRVDAKGLPWDSIVFSGDGKDEQSKSVLNAYSSIVDSFNKIVRETGVQFDYQDYHKRMAETALYDEPSKDGNVFLFFDKLEKAARETGKYSPDVENFFNILETNTELLIKLSKDKSHPYGLVQNSDIADYAHQEGYKAVVIDNIFDGGGNVLTSSAAVFDPSDIAEELVPISRTVDGITELTENFDPSRDLYGLKFVADTLKNFEKFSFAEEGYQTKEDFINRISDLGYKIGSDNRLIPTIDQVYSQADMDYFLDNANNIGKLNPSDFLDVLYKITNFKQLNKFIDIINPDDIEEVNNLFNTVEKINDMGKLDILEVKNEDKLRDIALKFNKELIRNDDGFAEIRQRSESVDEQTPLESDQGIDEAAEKTKEEIKEIENAEEEATSSAISDIDKIVEKMEELRVSISSISEQLEKIVGDGQENKITSMFSEIYEETKKISTAFDSLNENGLKEMSDRLGDMSNKLGSIITDISGLTDAFGQLAGVASSATDQGELDVFWQERVQKYDKLYNKIFNDKNLLKFSKKYGYSADDILTRIWLTSYRDSDLDDVKNLFSKGAIKSLKDPKERTRRYTELFSALKEIAADPTEELDKYIAKSMKGESVNTNFKAIQNNVSRKMQGSVNSVGLFGGAATDLSSLETLLNTIIELLKKIADFGNNGLINEEKIKEENNRLEETSKLIKEILDSLENRKTDYSFIDKLTSSLEEFFNLFLSKMKEMSVLTDSIKINPDNLNIENTQKNIIAQEKEISNTEELVKVEEKLYRARKEKENVSNEESIHNIGREQVALKELTNQIGKVVGAVKRKTDAFEKEQSKVSDVVHSEVSDLQRLETELKEVKDKVSDINSSSIHIQASPIDLKIDESANKILEESRAFDSIINTAKEAAESKIKFAEANKKVNESAMASISSISGEHNELDNVTTSLAKTSQEYKEANQSFREAFPNFGELSSITKQVGTYTDKEGNSQQRISYRFRDVNGNSITTDPYMNVIGEKNVLKAMDAYKEYNKVLKKNFDLEKQAFSYKYKEGNDSPTILAQLSDLTTERLNKENALEDAYKKGLILEEDYLELKKREKAIDEEIAQLRLQRDNVDTVKAMAEAYDYLRKTEKDASYFESLEKFGISDKFLSKEQIAAYEEIADKRAEYLKTINDGNDLLGDSSIVKNMSDNYKKATSGYNGDASAIKEVGEAFNYFNNKISKTIDSGRLSSKSLDALFEIQSKGKDILEKGVSTDNIKEAVGLIGKMKTELAQIQTISNKTSLSKLGSKVEKTLRENSAMSSDLRKKFKALGQEIKIALDTGDYDSSSIAKLGSQFEALRYDMESAGKVGKSTIDTILTRTKQMSQNFIAMYFSFYDIIRYTRTGINTLVSLDDALVDLSKTAKMSTTQLNDFYLSSNTTAKQMGVSTADIINQASAWSRLGYNTADTATKMAELSSQFASISPGMETDTAQEGLVSIMKAWNIDPDNVKSEIMDNINTLGNNFAETNEDIIVGMEKSAAALSAMGTSYEDSFALFTGAQEILQNAETTGTSLRSLSMRLRGYAEDSEVGSEQVDESLTNISGKLIDLTKTAENAEGISIYTDDTKNLSEAEKKYKSIKDYLGEISDAWNTFSETQQTQLLQTMFGKTRAQAGAAIITNFDQVEKAMTLMEQSGGSADKEMEKIRGSLTYKINALKETWTGFLMNLFNRKDFGNVIDSITDLSEDLAPTIEDLIPGIKTLVNLLNALIKPLSAIVSVAGPFLPYILGGAVIKNKFTLFSKDELNNWTLGKTKLSDLSNELRLLKQNLASGDPTGKRSNLGYAISNFALSDEARYLKKGGAQTDINKYTSFVNSRNAVGDIDFKAMSKELDISNKHMQGYLKTLNGGTATMKGFKAYCAANGVALKGLGLSARAAAIGMELLNSVISMGLSIAITFAFEQIANAVSAYTNRVEDAEKRTEEFNANIEEQKSELQSMEEWIDKNGTKFNRLAEGVDSLGNNVNLTSEEFKEYNKLSQEVADLFPNMIAGYDAQGNAILKNKNALKELNAEYEKEAQKGYAETVSKTDQTFSDYETQVADTREKESILDQLLNREGIKETEGGSYLVSNRNQPGHDMFNFTAKNVDSLKEWFNLSDDQASLLANYMGDVVRGDSPSTEAIQLIKSLKDSQGTIGEGQLKSIRETVMANLNYANGEYYFGNLSEDDRSLIGRIVGSLDDDFFKQFNGDVKALMSTIYFQFVRPLSVEGDKAGEAMRNIFSLDLNTINQENRQKLHNWLKIIADTLGVDDWTTLIPRFGLQDFEKISDLQTQAIERTRGKYSDKSFSDIEKDMQSLGVDSEAEYQNWNNAIASFETYEDALDYYRRTYLKKTETQSQSPELLSFDEAWKELDENITDENYSGAFSGLSKEKLENLSKLKESVLELGKAGNLSAEEFMRLDGATEFIEKTGLSAEGAAKKMNALVEEAVQLSGMRTGITAITGAYTEKKESEVGKNGIVSASTLESMYSTLGIEKWSLKNQKVWEEYKNAAGDASVPLKELKKRQDDLATSYVNSRNFLANLTNENKGYYIGLLKEMGIKNNIELVNNKLRQKEYLLNIEAVNSKKNTEERISYLEKLSPLLKKSTKEEKEYYFTKLMSNDEALNDEDYLEKLVKLGKTLKVDSTYVDALQHKIDALKGKDIDVTINQKTKITTEYVTTNNSKAPTSNVANPNAFAKAGSPTPLYALGYNAAAGLSSKTKSKAKVIAETAKIDDDAQLKTKVKTSTKNNNNNKKNKKSGSTASKTEIDWIQRRIERLNTQISLYNAQQENILLDDQNKEVSKVNKNLSKQIKKTKALESTNRKAIKKYQQKANSVKLSKGLRKKVQNGAINLSYKKLIKKYGQKTADRIERYKSYYDSSQTAKQSVQEAISQRRSLQVEQYQNYVDMYDARTAEAQAKESVSIGFKNQNKAVQTQIDNTKKSYDYQIKIAKLQKDAEKRRQLEYEKEKAIVDLQKQKVENIKTEYSNRIALLSINGTVRGTSGTGLTDIQNSLSLLEARGTSVSSAYYTNQNKLQRKIYSENSAELKLLRASLSNFKVGSDEWYSIQQDIQSAEDAMNSAKVEIANNNKAIVDLRDTIADDIRERNTTIANEISFLSGLTHKSTVDSSHNLTDAWYAGLQSNRVNYYTSKTSLNNDKAIYNALNTAVQNGAAKATKEKDSTGLVTYKIGGVSYNSWEEVIAARDKYMQAMQDDVKAMFDAESSLIESIKEMYQAQLDKLQDIISAKKELIDENKELYEYEKNISEKTKSIATIQKQIVALQGDTSEEGRAKMSKLQRDLDEAQKDLQDTEYDKYISKQEEMLDNMYSEYESLMNKLFDQPTKLLAEANKIAVDSRNYLKTMEGWGNSYGYSLSSDGKQVVANGMVSNERLSSILTSIDNYFKNLKSGSSGSSSSSTSTSSTAKTTTTTSAATKASGKTAKSTSTDFIKSGQAQVVSFIGRYATKAKKKKSAYSDINKKIYEYTNGKVLSDANLKKFAKALGVTYDNATKNGNLYKKLHSIGAAGFSTGGIGRLVKAHGEDGIAMVRNGEGFVRPENVKDIQNLMNIVPNMTKLVNGMNGVSGGVSVENITFSPVLPNVTDSDSFVREMQTNKKVQKAFTIAFNDLATNGRITNKIQSL